MPIHFFTGVDSGSIVLFLFILFIFSQKFLLKLWFVALTKT